MKRWAIFIVLVIVFFFSTRTVFANADSAKLDEVVQNQKKILTALDEIKAELQVIKVRSSNR